MRTLSTGASKLLTRPFSWGGPQPRDAADRVDRWGSSQMGSLRRKASKKEPAEDPDFKGLSYKSREDALRSLGLDPDDPHRPMYQSTSSLPGPYMDPRDGPSGPRAFPHPMGRSHQSLPPEDHGPSQHHFDPDRPPEGQTAILAAIAALHAQLEDSQRREAERDARLAEMVAQSAEASPNLLEQSRQRELDLKTEEIHRVNRENKLDELINSLREKSLQHDTLLRKIAEGPPSLWTEFIG